jgi:hypothetical protein
MRTPDEMSPAELYDAYSSGAISRRAFVARLTAFGVTAAVAAVYANSASATTTAGAGSPYGPGLYDTDLYLYGDLYPYRELYLYGDLY